MQNINYIDRKFQKVTGSVLIAHKIWHLKGILEPLRKSLMLEIKEELSGLIVNIKLLFYSSFFLTLCHYVNVYNLI